MNTITLGLFIFQVTFTLADVSPYRNRSHRFGKFDTRVKGKNVLFFYFLDTAFAKGPNWLRTEDIFAGSSFESSIDTFSYQF